MVLANGDRILVSAGRIRLHRSLEHVLKCNVYCTSVEKFAAVNAVYSRYFPKSPPARIFVSVPAWPGHFDIDIDCIAAVAGTT